MIRKLLLVAATALAVTGCAEIQNAYDTLTGVSITPNQVYNAANAFDALEQTATNYLSLPACTATGPLVCRNQTVAAQIVPAVRSGRLARNQLEAAVQSAGGTPVPATVYSVLLQSTQVIQQIVAEYNIGATK